jgi:hypothetical protein
MAEVSSKVLELRDHYERQAAINSPRVSGGCGELEQEIINKSLETRVKEVEQKSVSDQGPSPLNPCRFIPSMEKQVCEESAESAIGEDEDGKGDTNITPRNEDKEGLREVPRSRVDVHELEQKSEQVREETENLASELEHCEHTIHDLENQIRVLKEEKIRLMEASELSGELRADLSDQIEELQKRLQDSKHRERELQAQLEESRQIHINFKVELEEAKLDRIQQLRQREKQEYESEQQSRRSLHGQMDAAAQNLIQRPNEQSGFLTMGSAQFIYQRVPDDIDIIAQQSRQLSLLAHEKRRAKQEAQKYSQRAQLAELEAENSRQELAELKEKKQRKGDKKYAFYREKNHV